MCVGADSAVAHEADASPRGGLWRPAALKLGAVIERLDPLASRSPLFLLRHASTVWD